MTTRKSGKTSEGEKPTEVPLEVKQAAAAMGRLGGAAKSKAKTQAARANGAKGGRPPKNKPAS